MKWRTHQACGVGIAFLLHLSPVGIAAAWAGSLLPDIFDQRAAGLLSLGRRDRQAVFARIHRGISHWFLLWLLLFAAAWGPIDEICRELSLDTAHSPNILPYLRESAYGLGLGGFLHVALDMLTPRGVPVLPFSVNMFFLSVFVFCSHSVGFRIFHGSARFRDRFKPLSFARRRAT